MTSEILLADLVYARRLLEDGLSDPQVLTSLIARGVNPLQAAELLTDLHHNREPKVAAHYQVGTSPPGPAPKPGPAARAEDGPVPTSRSRRRRPSGVPWWALIIIVVFLWALWYAWLKTGVESSREFMNHDKHAIPSHPSKETQP